MSDMLNLPGLVETSFTTDADNYHIEVKVDTGEPMCCLAEPVVKNGTKRVLYRDTPMHGKQVGIWVHRQRWLCKKCGKTTYQAVPHLHARHEMTERLVAYIEKWALQRTFAAVAQEIGIDPGVTRGIWTNWAKKEMNKLSPVTPEWMGLDELHIRKTFRGVITNVKDHTIVDMLRNRNLETVQSYLLGIPDKEKIKLVAIDMWRPYKTAVQAVLPHAEIVVDKFHIMRMAWEAVESVRKDIRRSVNPADRLQLKGDRWLLLTNPEKLDSMKTLMLETVLDTFPTIKAAYDAKERYRKVWDATNVADAQKAYDEWEKSLAPDVEPAFRALKTAMANWRTEIFAYFHWRVTNAYTESFNALAKMVNRLGRGYSFEVLRARMLLAYGAHKHEPLRFPRELSSTPQFAAFIPQPRFLGVDISTLTGEVAEWPETP